MSLQKINNPTLNEFVFQQNTYFNILINEVYLSIIIMSNRWVMCDREVCLVLHHDNDLQTAGILPGIGTNNHNIIFHHNSVGRK